MTLELDLNTGTHRVTLFWRLFELGVAMCVAMMCIAISRSIYNILLLNIPMCMTSDFSSPPWWPIVIIFVIRDQPVNDAANGQICNDRCRYIHNEDENHFVITFADHHGFAIFTNSNDFNLPMGRLDLDCFAGPAYVWYDKTWRCMTGPIVRIVEWQIQGRALVFHVGPNVIYHARVVISSCDNLCDTDIIY
jgi:hypothetical protein